MEALNQKILSYADLLVWITIIKGEDIVTLKYNLSLPAIPLVGIYLEQQKCRSTQRPAQEWS